MLYLTDDGTLDTVIQCDNCGGQERYTYAERAEGETYDEFVKWAFADAEEVHECIPEDY